MASIQPIYYSCGTPSPGELVSGGLDLFSQKRQTKNSLDEFNSLNLTFSPLSF